MKFGDTEHLKWLRDNEPLKIGAPKMNAKEIEQEITEDEYESFLDDCYGDVTICGMKYSSGRALKELDPVAFRCGKSDYENGLERKWECSECNEVFEDEDEAEECCTSEETEQDSEI